MFFCFKLFNFFLRVILHFPSFALAPGWQLPQDVSHPRTRSTETVSAIKIVLSHKTREIVFSHQNIFEPQDQNNEHPCGMMSGNKISLRRMLTVLCSNQPDKETFSNHRMTHDFDLGCEIVIK